MSRHFFALALMLMAASPAAARPVVDTKLSAAIDSNGRASANLTVTNHSHQPICLLPKEEHVFLRATDGSVVGPVVAAAGAMWPDYMPVVWDDDTPREFELSLNTDFPGVDHMRQATRATYDFEAYDCAELFADRVHVRPRYKRKLSATISFAP
jgi:hypothetical protein